MPDIEMSSANDTIGFDVDYTQDEIETNRYYFYEWTNKNENLSTEKEVDNVY